MLLNCPISLRCHSAKGHERVYGHLPQPLPCALYEFDLHTHHLPLCIIWPWALVNSAVRCVRCLIPRIWCVLILLGGCGGGT
jgi:hypothetical protein